MLYHVYEMQRLSLAPLRFFAQNTLSLIDSPLNPLRPMPASRVAAAALDSFEHTTRQFGKPAFGHKAARIGNDDVEIVEEAVVSKLWCDLKRFVRLADRPHDRKLLVVAPMSGHHATLLRGTVKEFLPDHDVYITDWRDAREVPLMAKNFDLDDYIDYVMDFLRILGPETHVLAVCQPAVPVLAAVSLMNENEPEAAPRSMSLIGGPIDTREGQTAVNVFAKKHDLDWFKNNVIHRVPFGYLGVMRPVYPGFLQLAGFMAMNMDRHIDAHWQMFQHLVQGDDEPLSRKRQFYTEYRSVMDLPAEYYLQTIEAVFQEHRLPRGTFKHRGHKVHPASITRTAMFTIEGEKDDISGLGQTIAAHKLTTNLPASMRQHREQAKVGHYGLFNGSRYAREIAPAIKEFIAAHA